MNLKWVFNMWIILVIISSSVLNIYMGMDLKEAKEENVKLKEENQILKEENISYIDIQWNWNNDQMKNQ